MSKSRVVKITMLGTTAAIALAALSSPSQAQSPKKNPAPTEAGCYDVLGGPGESTASLAPHHEYVPEPRKFQTAIHPPDVDNPTPAEGHPHYADVDVLVQKATPKVDATSTLLTAAAAGEDCSAVRYRMRVFGETNRFITELVVPGQIGPTVELQTTFDKALLATATNDDGTTTHYAYFSVTTENASGQVGDTAPDAATGAYVDLTGGGATSYGG